MSRNLSDPVSLPCGLELPNRIVKAAMAEDMASPSDNNMPNKKHVEAYKRWANAQYGMILTGNVMVNARHLGQPNDVIVPDLVDTVALKRWKEWADATQSQGTPGVVQINHPGRQSPIGVGKRGIFEKTVAPSAVALNMGNSFLAKAIVQFVFGTPQPLTVEGIQEVIDDFVRAGKVAHKAGFKGVQLHGAHGYLLAQFLSPRTNLRDDAYGGSTKGRSKIVVEIVKKMREETSPEFCIGIKLNSTDFQADRVSEALEQIGFIIEAGVDFVEVSGGTYESPQMMKGSSQSVASSTSKREAFFLSFANLLRKTFPKTVVMVTGGLRSRHGMKDAINEGAVDLVGIGRPAAVVPDFPRKVIFNKEVEDDKAKMALQKVQGGFLYNLLTQYTPLKVVGTGLETKWYGDQIERMGRGLQPFLSNVVY